jgi:hypothetical protein
MYPVNFHPVGSLSSLQLQYLPTVFPPCPKSNLWITLDHHLFFSLIPEILLSAQTFSQMLMRIQSLTFNFKGSLGGGSEGIKVVLKEADEVCKRRRVDEFSV